MIEGEGKGEKRDKWEEKKEKLERKQTNRSKYPNRGEEAAKAQTTI